MAPIVDVDRLRRDDRGMTLPEIMVTMTIMSIVLLIVGTILASVQRATVREDSLTQTLDQARLALQTLDRELRSGNVLYDPALENAAAGVPGRLASCDGCLPSYTIRVYTQTNTDTRGTYRCVLWKIDANQRLMTRYWEPLDPDNASRWRVAAEGVVNLSLGEPAFTLDTDPLKGGRTLNVVYAVNSDLTRRPTQTVRVQAAITGRNTSYGYPGNVCQEPPVG